MIRLEYYKYKNLRWWDYLDLSLSFSAHPQIKGNKFTGKLGKLHMHVQFMCWCMDVSLIIRKDIK